MNRSIDDAISPVDRSRFCSAGPFHMRTIRKSQCPLERFREAELRAPDRSRMPFFRAT